MLHLQFPIKAPAPAVIMLLLYFIQFNEFESCQKESFFFFSYLVSCTDKSWDWKHASLVWEGDGGERHPSQGSGRSGYEITFNL